MAHLPAGELALADVLKHVAADVQNTRLLHLSRQHNTILAPGLNGCDIVLSCDNCVSSSDMPLSVKMYFMQDDRNRLRRLHLQQGKDAVAAKPSGVAPRRCP